MGMYDQAARYACRTQPRVVAQRLLRRVRERLELDQFHDTRTSPLPGQRDRTVDSVLALDDLDKPEKPEKPCLVILEFQAQHDEDKLSSTLVSVAHMHADVRPSPEGKGRYEVFAGLIYLRGKADSTELAMMLTDTTGQRVAGTLHQTLVWNVEEDDAVLVRAEIEADFDNLWGLLFWFPLTINAASAENLAGWLTLVQRVTSKRHRADLGRIALVFAELVGTAQKWREALKEFDMQESKLVLEWTADARAQQEVQTRREDVLRLAQKRFKAELTAEDAQMISTQEDNGVLRDWFDAAYDAKDYSEFRSVLRR